MITIEKDNFTYCDFCKIDENGSNENPIHKVTIKMDSSSITFHACKKHLKELKDGINSALNL